MQHQRAIVDTDETIIDRGERVHLEVNAATAGQSRLLSAEPSAALTKSRSRAAELHISLGRCPSLRAGAFHARAVPGSPGPRARSSAGGLPRPGRAPGRLRALPRSGAAQCRERGLAGHCCSGDAARVLSIAAQPRCSPAVSRDAQLGWQL